MISRTEIIFAMVTCDISDKTLFHQISKYKKICKSDVDEIIRIGVVGYLKPYGRFVAWVLKLNKYLPKDWKPMEIVREVTPRQIVMGWGNDIKHPNHKKGLEHKNHRDYASCKFDQTDKVDAIFNKLGGRAKMVEQLGVSMRMISNWRTYISVATGGRGTIPEKYIERILQISDRENLGITKDDFKTFTYKGR